MRTWSRLRAQRHVSETAPGLASHTMWLATATGGRAYPGFGARDSPKIGPKTVRFHLWGDKSYEEGTWARLRRVAVCCPEGRREHHRFVYPPEPRRWRRDRQTLTEGGGPRRRMTPRGASLPSRLALGEACTTPLFD